MKHGLVLTYQMMPPPWNQKTTDQIMNGRLDDPPTAGMFSKVSPIPTNHSKFTSRRKGHEHPVSKSKEKAKGTHKMRNGSDFKLVSWRVVDSGPGLGSSASDFLSDLDDFGRNDADEEEEEEDGIVDGNGSMGDPVIGSEHVEDDDNTNSFCDVGLFWERVYEDAGWCLVG